MTDRELETRKRIERELPDGVQQDLVAIVVKLQLARRLADTDPAGAAKLLEDIRGDAQEALDATRGLALRIYPPVLDARDLRAALRAAAPKAEVEVALGDECPEEVAAAVYLCCLDLLPAAAITVREEEGAVLFAVASTEAPDPSRVADRVEALGGRLMTEPGRVLGSVPV